MVYKYLKPGSKSKREEFILKATGRKEAK